MKFTSSLAPLLLLAFSMGVSAAPLDGQDFAGRPFITQPAPILKFAHHKAPQSNGIDCAFAEQTARGVALFGRFPEFKLSDRRIHLSGPWYDSAAANLQFSRGITSVEAMPNYRLDDAKFSIRDILHTQKWFLMTDPLFRIYATRFADELSAADPNDERIAPLRTFADDHKMTPHEAAYLALGRAVWMGERLAADTGGKGILYPCIDIEQTGGFEWQHQCQGWLFRGMAEAGTVRCVSRARFASDRHENLDRQNGQCSRAYTIHLKNGCSNFYDAWQLPPQSANLESKEVWLPFTDAAGQVRTWRGDWRAAVDESVKTPHDYHDTLTKLSR